MSNPAVTFEQALNIAGERLRSCFGSDLEARVVIEKSQEFDVGWVMPYQSTSFLESKNFEEMLVGNSPIFVARFTGEAFFVSYNRPFSESIAAFRACGNPNANEIAEVLLSGWNQGAMAVSAIKAVRQYASLGLADAKEVIDRCLGNHPQVVKVADVESAKALVSTLHAMGFQAEVRYDG